MVQHQNHIPVAPHTDWSSALVLSSTSGGQLPRWSTESFIDGSRFDAVWFGELGVRQAPKIQSMAGLETALKRWFGCDEKAPYGTWRRVREPANLGEAETLYQQLRPKMDRFAVALAVLQKQCLLQLESRYVLSRGLGYVERMAEVHDAGLKQALRGNSSWGATVQRCVEMRDALDATLPDSVAGSPDLVRGRFLISRLADGDVVDLPQFLGISFIRAGVAAATSQQQMTAGSGGTAVSRILEVLTHLWPHVSLATILFDAIPVTSLRHPSVVPVIRGICAGVEQRRVRYALNPQNNPEEKLLHDYELKLAAKLKPYLPV